MLPVKKRLYSGRNGPLSDTWCTWQTSPTFGRNCCTETGRSVRHKVYGELRACTDKLTSKGQVGSGRPECTRAELSGTAGNMLQPRRWLCSSPEHHLCPSSCRSNPPRHCRLPMTRNAHVTTVLSREEPIVSEYPMYCPLRLPALAAHRGIAHLTHRTDTNDPGCHNGFYTVWRNVESRCLRVPSHCAASDQTGPAEIPPPNSHAFAPRDPRYSYNSIPTTLDAIKALNMTMALSARKREHRAVTEMERVEWKVHQPEKEENQYVILCLPVPAWRSCL